MLKLHFSSSLCVLLAFAGVATAQSPSKAPAKGAPPSKVKLALTPATLSEPAKPDEAARVLDLRAFPLLEGANVRSRQTLGMLMYEGKGTPKEAYEIQKRELVNRGFQELPGTYLSDQTCAGHFTKAGFVVALGASGGYDPAKAGLVSVSLVNSGNVDLHKLPTPPGVKPFHPRPTEAAYTTDAPIAETAAACRKLILAEGWEPFGETKPDPNQPDSTMQWFKRNAIKLQLWVMKTPAEGGKTLIRYSTELLAADLPYPPGTADPRYTDVQKTLRFDSPKTETEAIIAFYQERLPKLGWKATTDTPIVDDRTRLQFLIFRNPAKEMLSLDLTEFTDIVRVELRHQTEAEVAEQERLAKEYMAKEKLAEAERNKKFPVALPLPAGAGNVEKVKENVLEFTLPTGSGPATLEAFRTHFTQAGWKEEAGAEFKKNVGDLEFQKEPLTLRFRYFDTGFTDAEITVSGSFNVVLEPVASKDKTATAPPAGKKPTAPAIPGLPQLPPGVELPEDVKALLENALKEAGQLPAKPLPKKSP